MRTLSDERNIVNLDELNEEANMNRKLYHLLTILATDMELGHIDRVQIVDKFMDALRGWKLTKYTEII